MAQEAPCLLGLVLWHGAAMGAHLHYPAKPGELFLQEAPLPLVSITAPSVLWQRFHFGNSAIQTPEESLPKFNYFLTNTLMHRTARNMASSGFYSNKLYHFDSQQSH